MIKDKGIKMLLIRGISGSGKSTLAKCFSDYERYEADMYFINPDGFYSFDATKLGRAHKWCQDSVHKELAEGKKVVVSNTFTTHREIKPYVDICKELNVSYMIIKCIGKFKNVHNVPQEVLEKMESRWQDFEGEVTYDYVGTLE
jgi:predicted kinase